MSLFQTPATVHSVRTLVDGSMKIDLITQELPPEEMTKLFQLKGKLGWFLMKENIIQEKDIPRENADIEGQKSYAARLRGTLWILHQKKGGKPEDFEKMRSSYMEKLLQGLKEQIAEYE